MNKSTKFKFLVNEILTFKGEDISFKSAIELASALIENHENQKLLLINDYFVNFDSESDESSVDLSICNYQGEILNIEKELLNAVYEDDDPYFSEYRVMNNSVKHFMEHLA